jgi:hypothetical protein
VTAWFGTLRERSESTQAPRGQNTLGTSLDGYLTSAGSRFPQLTAGTCATSEQGQATTTEVYAAFTIASA